MDSDADKAIEQFFSQFGAFTFKPGDLLLRADEQPVGIYYLKKGLVRQYTLSSKGETLVLHVFRPGSFFLMMWALNGTYNTYYYEAISPVETWRAPLEEVNKFFINNPAYLLGFTKRLLFGMEGLLNRMEYLMLEPAQIRTASLLIYLVKRFGIKDGKGIRISMPLSHKEIASWIGTTRETASLQMELLKKQGIIAYQKRFVTVNDVARLERLIATEQSIIPHEFSHILGR